MPDQPTKTRRRSGFEAKQIVDLFKCSMIPRPGLFPSGARRARPRRRSINPTSGPGRRSRAPGLLNRERARPAPSRTAWDHVSPEVHRAPGCEVSGTDRGHTLSTQRSWAVSAYSGFLRESHVRAVIWNTIRRTARKMEAPDCAAAVARRRPRPGNFILPDGEKRTEIHPWGRGSFRQDSISVRCEIMSGQCALYAVRRPIRAEFNGLSATLDAQFLRDLVRSQTGICFSAP